MDTSMQFDAVTAAVLRQGSKGGEVKEVQRRLKTWGYYKGSVDGVFGVGTKSEKERLESGRHCWRFDV